MILTVNKITESYWKVIINNPPINLFGPEFSIELMTLMDKMEEDNNLKVVVFESENPDYFIAHLDVLGASNFPKGEGKTGLSKSWPDMAKILNLSSRYLSDLLKYESGKTAIELIHLFLISEAKNLLLGTDKNIAEIGYDLGFENTSYFIKLFKKESGMRPLEFKKSSLN